MVSNGYAIANHRYMGKMFDKRKPSSYIMYYDANSLHSWGMSQKLRTLGCKWMINEDF